MTEQTTITINTDDTSIDLQAHVPSGERYINKYASLWHGAQCVGTTIIASHETGPERFDGPDWVEQVEQLLSNNISDAEDDAAWANAQEWHQIKSSV